MGKNILKRSLLVGIVFLFLSTTCIPVLANEGKPNSIIGDINGEHEYPDFPKNKMFMVGHFTTADEQESKGIFRDLYITCESGDISVFVAKWSKGGYSSWVFSRHFSKEYTYFHAPAFLGMCRDGQIIGITFGDLYYSS